MLKKLYWKCKNLYHVYYKFSSVAGLGCLEHKPDERDYVYENKLGLFFDKPQPKNEICFNGNGWVFDQKHFNICVFASNIMAGSYQEGKRFSVKFAVQMAKKLGYITGNGWSFLRAALDIANKYGRLPYEIMPDEINESWESYSRYQITEDMLIEAAKWRTPSYHKVVNAADAIELLDEGYTLITALKWFSDMNRPLPQSYYLTQTGSYIGGHAIDIPGYSAPQLTLKDYANIETFGADYADRGIARIKNIFASGFYDVYMTEKIPTRSDLERVTGRLEGVNVKGSTSSIYRVENGVKRGYANMDVLNAHGGRFYSISDNTLAVLPDGDLIIE